jgi:hypothetical protein
MRTSTLATLALTAVLGGGALILAQPTASAMVASGLSSAGIVETARADSPVQVVRHGRKHYYHPRRHGYRYRHRRDHYRYYYGGWWYTTPWWLYPPTYYYAPPLATPPVVTGRCAHWHNQCVRNWGYRNNNYYGCMRYYNCL